MFSELLVVFVVGYQIQNLNCLCPDYWMGFRNVFENGLPRSALKMVLKDFTLMCVSTCKLEPHCVAFAFHRQRKECHLYTRNVEELGSDPDPGMKVFLMITDGSNVASIKPPSTSSVGTQQQISAALDNDTNTCFQTHRDDYQPWFLVDLMETFLIRFILVYNEAVYPERLHDVNYEVYDSDPTLNNSSEGNCCALVVDYNNGKNIIRCKDGVHGRFVKISIEKSNFLTLCGVEIYGIPVNDASNTCNQTYECKKLPGGENIALRKPTEQSSTYNKVLDLPSKAVDGNKDGNLIASTSCQHSNGRDFTPWWQVDLEWMYDITSITISNRYDDKHLVGHRLSDVSVMVYDTDPRIGNPPSKLCIFIQGVFGCTVRTFECDEETTGRFIRITKPTEYLTMCEVEVTGIKQ